MKAFVQGVEGRFRGDALIAQCQRLGIDAEFVAGPDAQHLTEDFLETIYDDARARVVCGRSLSTAEVACTLGHLMMYEALLQSGDDWALMFEDDASVSDAVLAVLDELPDLPVRSIVTLRHEDAGAVVCWPWRRRGKHVRRLVGIPQGSSAYFMHREAAELAVKAADTNRLDCVPDWPLTWGTSVRWHISASNISPHADNPSSLKVVRDAKVREFVAPWGNGGIVDRVAWMRRLIHVGYPPAIAAKAAVLSPLIGKCLRALQPQSSRPDGTFS